MDTVSIESHQAIAVLRLTNGVTNAINPALVADCTQALEVVRQQYRGMVLTGGTKFLSIGLDLPTLLTFKRSDLIEFWRRFDSMLLALYTLPVPTACAVSGHATAGGTILAIACDFRFISPGRRLMGLNEIKLGVPVPYLANLILGQIVGDRVATDMTYGGDLIEPERAAAVGLVDKIIDEKELESRAVDKVAGIAKGRPEAFGFIKQSRVEVIAQQFKKYTESRLAQFLDCWFQSDVQTLLHQAAEKF